MCHPCNRNTGCLVRKLENNVLVLINASDSLVVLEQLENLVNAFPWLLQLRAVHVQKLVDSMVQHAAII